MLDAKLCLTRESCALFVVAAPVGNVSFIPTGFFFLVEFLSYSRASLSSAACKELNDHFPDKAGGLSLE